MSALEKVMEEYNEAYTSAKTEKQRDAVNKKFESKIDKAEKTLEKELEEQIKKENADLEAEQETDAQALVDLEKQGEIKILMGEVDFTEKYTAKELKDLARKYKIKGRSKLKNEDQLIKALLNAGVKL